MSNLSRKRRLSLCALLGTTVTLAFVNQPAPRTLPVLRPGSAELDVSHIHERSDSAPYAIRDAKGKPTGDTAFRHDEEHLINDPQGPALMLVNSNRDYADTAIVLRKTLRPIREMPVGRLARLPVTIGRRMQWVDLADVNWIEADDYYARLHTNDGVHLVRYALASLEQKLDPDMFVRVHRRALVNRTSVSCLTRNASGGHVLQLKSGPRVKVSGRRVRDVMNWLARAPESGAS